VKRNSFAKTLNECSAAWNKLTEGGTPEVEEIGDFGPAGSARSNTSKHSRGGDASVSVEVEKGGGGEDLELRGDWFRLVGGWGQESGRTLRRRSENASGKFRSALWRPKKRKRGGGRKKRAKIWRGESYDRFRIRRKRYKFPLMGAEERKKNALEINAIGVPCRKLKQSGKSHQRTRYVKAKLVAGRDVGAGVLFWTEVGSSAI